jgi:hypothetical protein
VLFVSEIKRVSAVRTHVRLIPMNAVGRLATHNFLIWPPSGRSKEPRSPGNRGVPPNRYQNVDYWRE